MAQGDESSRNNRAVIDNIQRNALSITGQASIPSMDYPASPDAFEAHDAAIHTKQSIEVYEQQMQGSAVRQGTLSESQLSTTLAFSLAATGNIQFEEKQKRKQAAADYLLLDSIYQSLSILESGLEAQYGDNFAQDMLADLVEAGKVSQDEYDPIATIKDKNEKRQAIAALIQGKLERGELTLEDLKAYEWAHDWLDLHDQAVKVRDLESQQVLSGEKNANGVSVDGGDQASVLTDTAGNKNRLTDLAQADVSSNTDERDTATIIINDLSIG